MSHRLDGMVHEEKMRRFRRQARLAVESIRHMEKQIVIAKRGLHFLLKTRNEEIHNERT